MAVACLFFGGIWAFANAWALGERRRTGRFRSTVPIVGAGFLAGGFFLIPATRPVAWVGFFLDPGTWDLLLALPKVFGEMWSTSRFNLLEEYGGQRERVTATLRLFRGGVFTLVQRIARGPEEPGVTGAGSLGRWRREGERLMLETTEGMTVVLAPSDGGGLRRVEGAPGLRKNPEFLLEGIVFELKR